MKVLILLMLVVFAIVAILLHELDPSRFDPLCGPSAGEVALPFALVAVVFVISVGVWKVFFKD
jgi:hypothetical protein